jgi:23S rRNA pseudouridine1911/1915/1917 synthase
MNVLYEDNHLLALNKPSGLPTMGAASGVTTLFTLAKDYIKEKYNKPGNVYLGIVSRLDAPVTGVVVMARTSKAARRLTEMFKGGLVEKRYWAIVWPPPEPAAGALVDWLREEHNRKMTIAPSGAEGAREARLTYRTLQTFGDYALLKIDLETGRKHQIRLQLENLGCTIVGDRKYGQKPSKKHRRAKAFPAGIALHARRLKLPHPVGQTPLEIIAPLPGAWKTFAPGIEAPGMEESEK